MSEQTYVLIGAPVDSGKKRRGCLMGPDAYRTAGLLETINTLGHKASDQGDIAPAPLRDVRSPRLGVHYYPETVAWTEALMTAAQETAKEGIPIFMGGDHSLSLGSVAGMAAYAAKVDRPLFVLWLDAHSDYHTPITSGSGNLHGTPLGYVTGRDGFEGFPDLPATVQTENICLLGLRSVDADERDALQTTEMMMVDMRAIDEQGIAAPLRAFLDKVKEANGLLHVSLDVDFLDPAVAPAVGTTVPGGATFREAHLVMEVIHDSGLLSSLDLVELNPFLDNRGRTASLMVDLTASLLGRRVFDRPTPSFS